MAPPGHSSGWLLRVTPPGCSHVCMLNCVLLCLYCLHGVRVCHTHAHTHDVKAPLKHSRHTRRMLLITHTDVHTQSHTHTQTHTHTHSPMLAHTHTVPHSHTHTVSRSHTRTQSHAHRHTQSPTLTHTHTPMHTHTHAHACTHTVPHSYT